VDNPYLVTVEHAGIAKNDRFAHRECRVIMQTCHIGRFCQDACKSCTCFEKHASHLLHLLELNATSPGTAVMFYALQTLIERMVLASKAGKVRVTLPATLLCSAFGGNWQQAGFKVQLPVFKDSACVAGKRAAVVPGPCSANRIGSHRSC
jgi:hypothetical protein